MNYIYNTEVITADSEGNETIASLDTPILSEDHYKVIEAHIDERLQSSELKVAYKDCLTNTFYYEIGGAIYDEENKQVKDFVFDEFVSSINGYWKRQDLKENEYIEYVDKDGALLEVPKEELEKLEILDLLSDSSINNNLVYLGEKDTKIFKKFKGEYNTVPVGFEKLHERRYRKI